MNTAAKPARIPSEAPHTPIRVLVKTITNAKRQALTAEKMRHFLFSSEAATVRAAVSDRVRSIARNIGDCERPSGVTAIMKTEMSR